MAPRGLPGPAVLAAAVFVGGAVSSPLVASDHSGGHPLPSKTQTTPSPTNNTGNGHAEYIVYALVPVVFVMGLFGVLICHLLKKKGYRCTTEAEQDVEGEKVEKIELNDSVNENSDTVGQIVQYIMKNDANVDVLAAMVADNSVCDPESPVTPSPPGSPPVSPAPLSPGGTPGKHVCGHHLHTVGVPSSRTCAIAVQSYEGGTQVQSEGAEKFDVGQRGRQRQRGGAGDACEEAAE
ncbi:unnamed protein product [Rangifer tarandus platyrhynchus]|uniref:Uncharacterized protein n=1 Tax=Rangifer tarandus platyrhynchus TaxID=3082113 RepID=A0AC59YEX6_RANTA